MKSNENSESIGGFDTIFHIGISFIILYFFAACVVVFLKEGEKCVLCDKLMHLIQPKHAQGIRILLWGSLVWSACIAWPAYSSTWL